MAVSKNGAPIGRPPKYKSPRAMQKKIDQYFKDCAGTPLLDAQGEVVLNKYDRPIIIEERPPTMSGLALALGFLNRKSIMAYEDKPEFMDTIARAKARVEEYAEARLFDKDGANGAKFALANNFDGWAEKQEVKADTDNTIHLTLGEDVKQYAD